MAIEAAVAEVATLVDPATTPLSDLVAMTREVRDGRSRAEEEKEVDDLDAKERKAWRSPRELRRADQISGRQVLLKQNVLAVAEDVTARLSGICKDDSAASCRRSSARSSWFAATVAKTACSMPACCGDCH